MRKGVKGKILDLKYASLLKVDTTLQKNVESIKIMSKNLCGIRTRIYVDKNKLFF